MIQHIQDTGMNVIVLSIPMSSKKCSVGVICPFQNCGSVGESLCISISLECFDISLNAFCALVIALLSIGTPLIGLLFLSENMASSSLRFAPAGIRSYHCSLKSSRSSRASARTIVTGKQ